MIRSMPTTRKFRDNYDRIFQRSNAGLVQQVEEKCKRVVSIAVSKGMSKAEKDCTAVSNIHNGTNKKN